MPKKFDNCIKKGGKVFTKTLSGGKYIHGCELNGQTAWGYVKQKNSIKRKKI